jgi:hypothetical protein
VVYAAGSEEAEIVLLAVRVQRATRNEGRSCSWGRDAATVRVQAARSEAHSERKWVLCVSKGAAVHSKGAQAQGLRSGSDGGRGTRVKRVTQGGHAHGVVTHAGLLGTRGSVACRHRSDGDDALGGNAGSEQGNARGGHAQGYVGRSCTWGVVLWAWQGPVMC